MMSAIATSCLLLLVSLCGWESVHAKVAPIEKNFGIYGGDPIKITEVPYMAIYRPRKAIWSCGASIVHEQFLVTAAHCVGKRPNKYSIVVGTDNAKQGGKEYDIAEEFVHPKYFMTYKGIDYDIAVIKTKEKIVFSDRVKPIKMADSTLRPKPGDRVQSIGFGLTEHQKLSEKLLMVKLPFVDLKNCQEMYSKLERWNVTERMICAGGEVGKGDCNGDSGGALTFEDKLIGVVSWGHNPCAEKYPTVFSDVPSMRDFVDEIIRKNS